MRNLLFALAVLALPCVARAELSSAVLQLGPDLNVKVLHGYPRSSRAFHGPLTIGLDIANAGREREMRVEVQGDVDYVRTLRLAAGERRRWFVYLPVGSAHFMRNTLTVTDLTTGLRREQRVESEQTKPFLLTRLGPLSFALNVDKPFTMLTPLDGYMPDDWRGLAGIDVIVVEHAQAVARPLDWRVFGDWMAAGGVLVLATPLDSFARPMPPADVRLPLASAVTESQVGLIQRIGLGALARVYPEQLGSVSEGFLEQLGLCKGCGWSVDEHMTWRNAEDQARIQLRYAMSAAPGTIFGTLLCFVLVVGPGGYLHIVKRRKRPLAYLGFVLVASVAFSVLVMGVDLVRNGIDERVVPRSLVVVDQQTDTEFGVEEIAAHVPFGPSLALHERPGLQLLLPMRFMRSEGVLTTTVGQRGMTVRGAVALRTRQLIGARWLGRARGRLVAREQAGGLEVENHLGADLFQLAVWHDGAAYSLPLLKRGARGVAKPALESRDDTRSRELSAPFTVAAKDLLERVARGQVAQNRYLAAFRWHPGSSGVLDNSITPFQQSTQLIAGVY